MSLLLISIVKYSVLTSCYSIQFSFGQKSILLHLHEIMEGLYFHCILSVCLCVRLCMWTKFQPNGCTDLYTVFAKRLLSTLARTLLKLVILGQRSRSQWIKINFFFIILCQLPYCISRLSYVWSIWNLVCCCALIRPLHICIRIS